MRRWGLIVALAAAMPVLAKAALDLDRLRELVEGGQMQAAYELAREHVEERAGDLRFDVYYGIAAVDTGHVAEGAFALERVLMRQPGLDRARLEYARALYLQGDDRRAQRQFEIVLAHDPPAGVVDRVERYLAAMERRADRYRTKVTGYLGTELGYDDNVNRAPDAEAIDIVLGTLVLDEDSREQDDTFLRTNGQVEVSHPLRPGLNLIGGVHADLRRHSDESDFDTSLAGGRVGLRWLSGPHRLSGFFQAQRFYVGHDPYQGLGELSGLYRYRFNDRFAAHALARVTRLRYDTLEVLDSTIALVGGGLSRSWPGRWQPRGSFTLLAGEEDAEEDSVRARALAERDILELRGQFAVTVAPQWTVRSSLRFRDSDYDERTFPFAAARDEDYHRLAVAAEWRPDARWRLGPYISYEQNDSNVELFEYERTVVGFRARYSFF